MMRVIVHEVILSPKLKFDALIRPQASFCRNSLALSKTAVP